MEAQASAVVHEARALIERAMTCHRSGKLDEAETLYQDAGNLIGDRSAVALPLGSLYLQRKKFTEASSLLDGHVERYPDLAEAWAYAGHARLQSGRAAAAAYAFLRALALKPDDRNIEAALTAAIERGGGLEAVIADPALARVEPGFAALYAEIFGPRPKVVHPIFVQYPPWAGVVPDGFHATPYGSLIRNSFYGPTIMAMFDPAAVLDGPAPPVDEGYFEWADLVESIAAAKTRFTMVELGAGFGRWIVAAACAIRMHRAIPFHLVGVEAEAKHFEMMHQHFVDNGLDPAEHRLIKAAVAETNGEVRFLTGNSEDWWGQSIAGGNGEDHGSGIEVIAVPALTIESILDGIDLVDLIDMDIQGAEVAAIRGSRDALCAKVKRIHIGTHGATIERRLARLFTDMGWVCSTSFPCGQTVDTDYGQVSFGDGIQTWINPALRHR